MNYKVEYGKTKHYFMQAPSDAMDGNQADGSLAILSNIRLRGSYTTCADAKGYLDWRYKRFGLFFKAKGLSYGFIKSKKHYAFTTETYGIRFFNYEIHFGKSYNFAKTKTGKRSFGLMVFMLRLKPTYSVINVPSVEDELKLKEAVIVDPHLRQA